MWVSDQKCIPVAAGEILITFIKKVHMIMTKYTGHTWILSCKSVFDPTVGADGTIEPMGS